MIVEILSIILGFMAAVIISVEIVDGVSIYADSRRPKPTPFDFVLRGRVQNGWKFVLPKCRLAKKGENYKPVPYNWVSSTCDDASAPFADDSYLIETEQTRADGLSQIIYRRFSVLSDVAEHVQTVEYDPKIWRYLGSGYATAKSVAVVFLNETNSCVGKLIILNCGNVDDPRTIQFTTIKKGAQPLFWFVDKRRARNSIFMLYGKEKTDDLTSTKFYEISLVRYELKSGGVELVSEQGTLLIKRNYQMRADEKFVGVTVDGESIALKFHDFKKPADDDLDDELILYNSRDLWDEMTQFYWKQTVGRFRNEDFFHAFSQLKPTHIDGFFVRKYTILAKTPEGLFRAYKSVPPLSFLTAEVVAFWQKKNRYNAAENKRISAEFVRSKFFPHDLTEKNKTPGFVALLK